MESSSTVVLADCLSYEDFESGVLLSRVWDMIDAPKLFPGMRVLLKPNLVSSRASRLACTDARFIRTVVLFLRKQGVSVALGDSPAFGSCKSVCCAQGIETALADLEVEYVEFTGPRKKIFVGGYELGFSQKLFEYDLLINLPKIKSHGQTYVTAAVKNWFGAVCGMQKAMLHMREGKREGFADIIVGLQKVIPPHIVLADGIVAIHKGGPISGASCQLKLVGAATSSVAFDTVLLPFLGVDPLRSPLYLASRRVGLPEASLENISYKKMLIKGIFREKFIPPKKLSPIRFSLRHFFMGMFKRAVRKVWHQKV